MLNWVIHFGETKPQADEWRTLDAQTRSELKGYRGTVWLQRTLPELVWEHPYLFFSLMHRFEAYLDDRLLYQFNMDNAHRYYHHQYVLHPVLIRQQDEGKTLLIRTEWEGHALVGNDLVLAGEADQLLYVSILTEISWLIYSLLSLFCGFAGLVMFIRGRKALYGWFALLCLSMGGTLLFSCRALQWFVDMVSIYYWKELLVPVNIWAGMGLYFNVLNANSPIVSRIGHYTAAVQMLLTTVLAIGFPHYFLQYSTAGHTLIFVIGFLFISYSLVRGASLYKARNNDEAGGREERMWLVRGYWTLLLCSLAGLTSYLVPSLLTDWLVTRTYLYRIIESLWANGVFLFIICLVMVLVARVRGVHRESQRIAKELLV